MKSPLQELATNLGLTDTDEVIGFDLSRSVQATALPRENGAYEVGTLLALIKANAHIEVEYGAPEDELSQALISAGEDNGYTYVTDLEDNTFFAGFAQPMRVASLEDIATIDGLICMSVQTKSKYGNASLHCHVFCENHKLDTARDQWSQTDSVLTNNFHIID